MSVNYHSLFNLILVMIGVLLVSLALDRGWCERLYDLRGKTILITGGSRGLGLVMARQLKVAHSTIARFRSGQAELIIQDALFHLGLAGVCPATLS